jgi:hypothetical protein
LLDFFAHAGVELDLHRMQVEVNILPKADQECQRLFDTALFSKMAGCSQL